MKIRLLPPRDQLVAIMSRIYHGRMTTLSGGNLSILDVNGDVWITPAGTDKGEMVADDIVRVRAGGSIEGRHRPSSEYPFHRAIYARRPDLGAIVHAHPPALVSFSIAHQVPDTCIVPHTWQMCGRAGYAPYALTGSEELGEQIATTFAGGYNAVLLENHGVVTGGQDLLEAFQRLETLEFSARTLLKARRLGHVASLTDEQLGLVAISRSLSEFTPQVRSSSEDALRRQVVHGVQRACDRSMMTSTEGVVSARVDERSFLITPAGRDRPTLEAEDVVLVQDGQREAGKVPSRAVHLHAAIYETHPSIGCVIMARPPNVMAYAVTGAAFDTRTIPESYIFLRDVPLIPYGVQFHAPREVAAALSPQTPVLLLRNDTVVTVGESVLAALDRLEVAEFTAEALLDAGVLGGLVPIGDDSIAELKVKFGL